MTSHTSSKLPRHGENELTTEDKGKRQQQTQSKQYYDLVRNPDRIHVWRVRGSSRRRQYTVRLLLNSPRDSDFRNLHFTFHSQNNIYLLGEPTSILAQEVPIPLRGWKPRAFRDCKQLIPAIHVGDPPVELS